MPLSEKALWGCIIMAILAKAVSEEVGIIPENERLSGIMLK